MGMRLQMNLPGPRQGRLCDFPKTGMNLQLKIPLLAFCTKKKDVCIFVILYSNFESRPYFI
jgi:hypothetical protein